MPVTVRVNRLHVPDVVSSEYQTSYRSGRMFRPGNTTGKWNLFNAVKHLISTNKNKVHSITALQCRTMQPVGKPKEIVFRASTIGNKWLPHWLHLAVMIWENVNLAKLFNSTVRGWLTDLWAEDLVEKGFPRGIVEKDYWTESFKEVIDGGKHRKRVRSAENW